MTAPTPEPSAYLLPAELRAALIAYLVTRPYAEVAQGVYALQALSPAPFSTE